MLYVEVCCVYISHPSICVPCLRFMPKIKYFILFKEGKKEEEKRNKKKSIEKYCMDIKYGNLPSEIDIDINIIVIIEYSNNK